MPGKSSASPAILVAALLAAVLAAAASGAVGALPDPADPALPAAERLPALFERVREQQKQLRSLDAQFVQKRESSMLAAP